MTDTESKTNEYSLADVEGHTTKESCWIVIHGKVHDVASFLDEHPGGEDILLENAGRDATEEFEDIGHTASAREMLKKYEIGVCNDVDPSIEQKKEEQMKYPVMAGASGMVILIRVLLPLLVVAIAVVYSYYWK